jgi:hypothetical protein
MMPVQLRLWHLSSHRIPFDGARRLLVRSPIWLSTKLWVALALNRKQNQALNACIRLKSTSSAGLGGFWCDAHGKAAELVSPPGSTQTPVAGKPLLEHAELLSWPAAGRIASLLLLLPAFLPIICRTAVCKDTTGGIRPDRI